MTIQTHKVMVYCPDDNTDTQSDGVLPWWQYRHTKWWCIAPMTIQTHKVMVYCPDDNTDTQSDAFMGCPDDNTDIQSDAFTYCPDDNTDTQSDAFTYCPDDNTDTQSDGVLPWWQYRYTKWWSQLHFHRISHYSNTVTANSNPPKTPHYTANLEKHKNTSFI